MILPKITNKQQEILLLLYQFRFLNRIQIQALLNHKDYKTINSWLKDLNQKEYINRIYSNKAGDNMKPAIYYISLNGIRHLRSLELPSTQLRKLVREKEKSEHFISKHILIADIWLDFQSKSDDKVKYAAATSSDINDPDYKFNFLAELGPDMVFAKISKDIKKYHLLEIFEPTLPLYSVRKKIRNYIDFYFSNSWEDNTGEEFPTLLFICPTTSMLICSKRFAKKMLNEYDNETGIKIQFTTESNIKCNSVVGNIWEQI